MNVLVIDVGGSHIKFKTAEQTDPTKLPSGHDLTPQLLVSTVQEATKDWQYDGVSIGWPGPVVDGKPAREPWNLGTGWVGFDFSAAFGKPVKLINDAAMQAAHWQLRRGADAVSRLGNRPGRDPRFRQEDGRSA